MTRTMTNVPRRSAIKFAAVCTLLAWCGAALAAQVAGTVVNLSGPLMVRKADGSVKALGVKSEVEPGDTLVSEKNTYAQIKFIDNSEITLKPGTTFKVEAFAYDSAKPEGDSASFSLVKGGLRSITGLLGKRNREKFELKTPAATIGIRGTTFVAQYVDQPGPGGATPVAPGASLAPGLHVSVTDGAIMVSNQGGAQQFAAGQFGYTATALQPPLIVPPNPALKFTPPPVFANPSTAALNTPVGKSGGVDCIVR